MKRNSRNIYGYGSPRSSDMTGSVNDNPVGFGKPKDNQNLMVI